jgi:heavy metal sensor kinase
MFFARLSNLLHTLALRLTLWYAGVFAFSSIIVFAVVYGLVVSIVAERTDEDLEEDVEELATFHHRSGLSRVIDEMMVETEGEAAEDAYFRLWSRDGRLLEATDLSAWAGLADPRQALAALASSEEDEPVLTTRTLPGREYPARVVYGHVAPDTIIEIGETLEEQEEFIEDFRAGFLVTLAIVLALGAPIGWFMARRALRGVDEITQTASEIAQGELDRRVQTRSRGDELDRLAQTFNTMLDRIQALIIGMREMTDNLAHDFRSPLGRIRTAAELSLAGGGTLADAEALAATTTEECDRLLEMINATLDIAETESGAARLRITEVDLARVVADAVEVFHTVAEDRKIAISTELPAACRIRGDLGRLQRVVANLMDNALKYTPPGGAVKVTLAEEGERVKLSFADTGTGIPAEELTRIFERFYRCDRSRTEYGNGLGLSLALAFVRAHGGDITVDSTPDQGSTFTVTLARAPERR